jgi:hypothetical protein
MRRWLRDPTGELAALSFLPYLQAVNARQGSLLGQRVRRNRVRVTNAGASRDRASELGPDHGRSGLRGTNDA